MGKSGKDHSGIAHDGFEHTLRTKEAKERFNNEPIDVSSLPLKEQLEYWARFEEEENLYVHCAGGYRCLIALSIL